MSLYRNLMFIMTGTRHFTRGGYLAACKHFDNTPMTRSLKGKVVMVTGANSGLGFKASEEFARLGAKLLMVCRSAERGAAAVAAVQAASGNPDVHLLLCDLSSVSQVRRLVEEYRATCEPLHVLVNNAGVMVHEQGKSADGHDINFATNTLGTWALTSLLEDVLAASSPSRVIFVSSGGMLTETLEVSDLQNATLNPYDGTRAYAKDKRRQVAMAERFAQLWTDRGIGVYSMHPGWADTEGVRTSIPGFHKSFEKKLRDTAMGVDTILYLSLQDSEKLVPGAFYLDRQPQRKHLPLAATKYTAGDVDLLWTRLGNMLK